MTRRQDSFKPSQSINQILQAAFQILTYEKVRCTVWRQRIVLSYCVGTSTLVPWSVGVRPQRDLRQAESVQDKVDGRKPQGEAVRTIYLDSSYA